MLQPQNPNTKIRSPKSQYEIVEPETRPHSPLSSVPTLDPQLTVDVVLSGQDAEQQVQLAALLPRFRQHPLNGSAHSSSSNLDLEEGGTHLLAGGKGERGGGRKRRWRSIEVG